MPCLIIEPNIFIGAGLLIFVSVPLFAFIREWKQTSASPRCGRFATSVLRFIVPVWAYLGTFFTVTTAWMLSVLIAKHLLSLANVPERIYIPITAISSYFGIGLALVLASKCTRLALAKLDAWLAHDPAADD